MTRKNGLIAARELSQKSSGRSKMMCSRNLLGSSPKFRAVLEGIKMVAPVDCAVLLQGETGTGKEVIARAIHQASPRRQNRFVALNCAAIPGALLESELFGHERGAFTDAVTQTTGRFQAAVGGRNGAAAKLGLARTTLISRMQKLGIARETVPEQLDHFTATTNNISPECGAGALNVQSCRFCDHASIPLKSAFQAKSTIHI
jgi:transcriptional regulator with GAF, ATPase, and Fis domain